MIDSTRNIVINRCQNTLCRHVMILIPEIPRPIAVLETGSESCEHVYDPARVVVARRDVLALHGLWTVGRHVGTHGMDRWAHVLAESLGYQPGEDVPITEIPLQLVYVDGRELTWQGVCAAFRVARATRDQRGNIPAGHVLRWSRITEYLGRWQHHVL